MKSYHRLLVFTGFIIPIYLYSQFHIPSKNLHNSLSKKLHKKHVIDETQSSLSVCDIGFIIFHSPGEYEDETLMSLQRSWLQDLCGPDSSNLQHPYPNPKPNYVILSSKDDPEVSLVDTQCSVHGNLQQTSEDCCKTNFFLNKATQLLPGKKWYFKVEDSLFVRPETVLRYLQTFDETKPLLIGGELFSTNPLMNNPSGHSLLLKGLNEESLEGGYAVTSVLVQTLSKNPIEGFSYHEICQKAKIKDMAIASMVRAVEGGKVYSQNSFSSIPVLEPTNVHRGQPYLRDSSMISWRIKKGNLEKGNFKRNHFMPSLRYLTRRRDDFDPSYTGYVESEPVSILYPNPCIDVIGQQQSLLIETYASLLGGCNKAAIIGFPDYPNRGDSAIWIGEAILMKKLGIKLVYERNTEKTYRKEALSQLLGNSSTSCIIFTGGGHMGDIYRNLETFRQQVVQDFPTTPIFSFPQTVWFKQKENIETAQRVYGQHPRLQLAGRDQASFDFLEEHFNVSNGINALPDMAFMMGNLCDIREQYSPSVDILFISRKDPERVHGRGSEEFYGYLNGTELGQGISYLADDWFQKDAPEVHSKMNAYEKAWTRTADGLKFLSRAKVAITNRLHGHILLVMLGIPHSALDNSYGKLGTYYEAWTSECPLVKKLGTIEESVKICKKILLNSTTSET